MAVTVAEYLGANANTNPQPHPVVAPGQPIPGCPFTGLDCVKIGRGAPPVCSVWADNELWITCDQRLLSARQAAPINHQYINVRATEISSLLWPHPLTPADVAVARQFTILTSQSDFVFALNPGWRVVNLPVRYVMEIQGGGDTTGSIAPAL